MAIDVKEHAIVEGTNLFKNVVYLMLGVAALGSVMTVMFGGSFAAFATAVLP